MFSAPGEARPHYQKLLERFQGMGQDEFDRKRTLADTSFLTQGITFTVYNDNRGTEKIFPFDLIPRIIPADEWEYIERGLEQRIRALNLFLHDIYHDQRILREKVIPEHYVLGAAHFRKEFMGFNVPRDIYIHICGTDLIRDHDGRYPRAGGQRPLPLRRVVRAGKPTGHEARVPAAVRPVSRAPGG